MDPAALLFRVNALCNLLDDASRSHPETADVLASIQSQLKSLEASLAELQHWLHYSDPQSEAQVSHGLQETLKTINKCVQQCQEGLDAECAPDAQSSVSGTESSDLARSRTALNSHYVNVRQCLALTQFSLAVCQMPFSLLPSQESKELVLGAKLIQHAHSSSATERRTIINSQYSVGNRHGSPDFKVFLTSVVDAERDLAASSTLDSSVDEQPTQEITDYRLKSTSPRSRHNDEMFLPENEHADDISLPQRPPVPPKGPVLPPKVQDTRPNPATATLQKQLSRKPVRSPSRRTSVYAESVLTEMTLDASPIMENEKAGANGFVRRESTQRSTSGWNPGATNTSALFSQASRSLNSLAQEVDDMELNDNTIESPPPYVTAARSPSFPQDVKRRNTQGSMDLSLDGMSLIEIVRENHIDFLLALLDRGTNIDEADPITKRTAIIEATNLRRTRISQILIEAGCRLHLRDVDLNTALHYASFNGDARMCTLLLNSGASLNEYNREGETPLDLAARRGHTEACLCLLNNWTTQNGHATTLLKGFLEATKSGNASTAQVFIERGIQPKKLKEAWKPVVFAAMSGSVPMIDLMLAEKCNMKAKCPEGWTALHYAAQAGHTAVVEKLLAHKVSWSSQTSKVGETALHVAILAGQISTAVALVYHKGANISIKDNDNHQAIHHATRLGDVQLTTLLLNKGAKIDAETNYGWTPMLIAAGYGHMPLVAEFITRGVSVEDKLQQPSNSPGKKTNEAAKKGYWNEIRWPHPGARCIHLALEFGHDDVVRTLIASGAKITEEDSKGWRPLHYAAWNCRPMMVELLLNRGASPHVTTASGHNSLSLGFREQGLAASMEDRQAVFEILQAAMHARKKSTLTKISEFKGIGPKKTKDVDERNRAWHTAELAAALYLAGQLDDGESDRLSQLAPSTTSLTRRESKEQDDAVLTAQASSCRPRKRPTD